MAGDSGVAVQLRAQVRRQRYSSVRPSLSRVIPIASGSGDPSSSLLDGLGRVHRVKGRFARLNTTATTKGGQLRGGRRGAETRSQRPVHVNGSVNRTRRDPPQRGRRTGRSGDGRGHVRGGGRRYMRAAETAETGVVRLITQRSRAQIPPRYQKVQVIRGPDRQEAVRPFDHPLAVRWRDRSLCAVRFRLIMDTLGSGSGRQSQARARSSQLWTTIRP
jgi:hypothetical protein